MASKCCSPVRSFCTHPPPYHALAGQNTSPAAPQEGTSQSHAQNGPEANDDCGFLYVFIARSFFFLLEVQVLMVQEQSSRYCSHD